MANILTQLEQAINAIDRPGSFCVWGAVPAILPGLEVEGMGSVAMPLTVKQARELKKLCEQAPYGKGEQTLVDRSVRRVWRLTPEKFSLSNPAWSKVLGQMMKQVQEGLGLEKQKLESQLYDLLLYEPGSFFLPHRDGEKLDRMVATLVVALPSSFEGGELVVRHEGQEQTIDFRSTGPSAFEIHFAAFYADCEHEIRPVRKGYRLCLVYNLTLARGKKSLAAPRESEHIDKISSILRAWPRAQGPRKLALLLEHQYTQDGLAWDALKGTDRARANILLAAARQASCRAYLALLTFYESGSAVDDGGYYAWSYDEEDEEEESSYEMEEVFDSTLSATGATSSEGQSLPIEELYVEEEEILNRDELREVEAEEEYEGYTGNEGMTLQRWYRHAALLLWPEARHFEVLCEHNSRRVVPLLEEWMTQWKQLRKSEERKKQCLDLAAAILAHWPENQDAYSLTSQGTEGVEMLALLAVLNDAPLIRTFLGKVLPADPSIEPGPSLPKVCNKHGWKTFQAELVNVCKNTTAASVGRNVRLLEQVCLARGRAKEGWSEQCRLMAEELVARVERIDTEKPSYRSYEHRIDRVNVLAGLTRALIASDQPELLSRVIEHALALPRKYPLTEGHLAALAQLRPWLEKCRDKAPAALTRWLAACRQQLEALTVQAPQEPTDFRREAAIRCTCADCRELKRFLTDASAAVHRFSIREDRRRHLADVIRDCRCDLDLKTERTRSPHTLVCTKNKASYQEKLQKYQQDREHLEMVLALQTRLSKGR